MTFVACSKAVLRSERVVRVLWHVCKLRIFLSLGGRCEQGQRPDCKLGYWI